MEKKFELPTDFGKKWVEALRSGEYQQTRCTFNSGNCYCATGLGFLSNGFDVIKSCVSLNGNQVDAWSGGAVIPRNLLWEVIDKNDTYNMSFGKIADWIEQNVNFI